MDIPTSIGKFLTSESISKITHQKIPDVPLNKSLCKFTDSFSICGDIKFKIPQIPFYEILNAKPESNHATKAISKIMAGFDIQAGSASSYIGEIQAKAKTLHGEVLKLISEEGAANSSEVKSTWLIPIPKNTMLLKTEDGRQYYYNLTNKKQIRFIAVEGEDQFGNKIYNTYKFNPQTQELTEFFQGDKYTNYAGCDHAFFFENGKLKRYVNNCSSLASPSEIRPTCRSVIDYKDGQAVRGFDYTVLNSDKQVSYLYYDMQNKIPHSSIGTSPITGETDILPFEISENNGKIVIGDSQMFTKDSLKGVQAELDNEGMMGLPLISDFKL